MCAAPRTATLRPVEAKTMISKQTIRDLRESTGLSIAWRSSKKLARNRRRHAVLSKGKVAKYVLQEFVDDSDFGHWSNISNLEVLNGGRAA
jgi:hypothetical protein